MKATRSNLMLWALLATSSVLAESATLRVVTKRQFPEGWTEPQVTTNHGATSYVPSIPSGLESRDVGAVLDVGAATVHSNVIDAGAAHVGVKVTEKLQLRLKDGGIVAVTLGAWTRVGEDLWRVTQREDGYYYLHSLRRGRTWRFRSLPQAEK